MRRSSRALLAAVTSLLAVSALAVPAAAGPGDTWTVGQPSTSAGTAAGSCASPDFTDIQSAVDAAGPNDTIVVCDGTYQVETVSIKGWGKRGLTVKAAHSWKATIKPTDNGYRFAALEVVNTRDVTIQGLRFQGPGQCDTSTRTAISAEDATNVDIRGNRIVSPPGAALRGCGFESGIWLDDATGVVRNNLVQDWQYLGILTEDNDEAGTVRIIGNSLRFWHKGISGVTYTTGTGIYIHDGDRREFKVNNNRVVGLPSAGTEETGTTPMLGEGIYLEGRRMTVLNNLARYAEQGLFAYDYPMVGVRRNTALDNRTDCGSDVLSPRWVDNIGVTSDPEGLCTAPPL